MVNKWNGKPCPLCGKGTLHEGVKASSQRYKGHSFSSKSHGAFCDHCSDGIAEYAAAEEAAWLAFRDQVDAAEAVELARMTVESTSGFDLLKSRKASVPSDFDPASVLKR